MGEAVVNKRDGVDSVDSDAPSTSGEVIPPSKKLRDYQQEKAAALERTLDRITGLRDDRDTGILGDEVIKYAQIMILSALPYRPTKERQFVRTARLSDGSTLRITFTAGVNGIDMPFGNDQDCLVWLLNAAIKSDNPFVSIKNARQYFKDTGKKQTGGQTKDLAARLRRISGLFIGIERRGADDRQIVLLPVIERSNLPNNLRVHLDSEHDEQRSLATDNAPYGLHIDPRIFKDAKIHHAVIPQRLWIALQGQKGGPQLRALLNFFLYRCYCAQSETIIPWAGLREQFPQDDSNPNRFKVNVKKAIAQMKIIWPQARIDVVEQGVWLAKPVEQLLPDDPSKRRVRRLDQLGD